MAWVGARGVGQGPEAWQYLHQQSAITSSVKSLSKCRCGTSILQTRASTMLVEIPLSPRRREVMEALYAGAMMIVGKRNITYVNEISVSPEFRKFFTQSGLVSRLDKSKPVTADGNGFVITEKGRGVLQWNRDWEERRRKRTAPKPVKPLRITEKTCPQCKQLLAIDTFVNIYGYPNPRGKYCRDCFAERQRQSAIRLMDGRDFCLYCGTKVSKVYDYAPNGDHTKVHLHRDHMDPFSLGGEDNGTNTVFCCPTCNLKKGDKLFVEWLDAMDPAYRGLARQVYIEKHGHEPEEFTPPKYGVCRIVESRDEDGNLIKRAEWTYDDGTVEYVDLNQSRDSEPD